MLHVIRLVSGAVVAGLVVVGANGAAIAASPGRIDISTSMIVSDSGDVAAIVSRYHAALASGDSSGALALLSDDAVILESGSAETRDEYRAHHLPADIEFARALPSQRAAITVRVRGDVAWASSTSTTQGEFRGRTVNSSGAELMVLSRERDGWKIRAIHWSSRTRRPG